MNMTEIITVVVVFLTIVGYLWYENRRMREIEGFIDDLYDKCLDLSLRDDNIVERCKMLESFSDTRTSKRVK